MTTDSKPIIGERTLAATAVLTAAKALQFTINVANKCGLRIDVQVVETQIVGKAWPLPIVQVGVFAPVLPGELSEEGGDE